MTTRTETRRPRAAAPSDRERFADRRRALRRRQWLRRAAVLLGLVLAGGLVWLVAVSPVLGVRRVEVSGTDRVTPALVTLQADVPQGRPLVRLDLAAIRARVEQIPAVASVEVSRVWPGTVRIQVSERRPVLAARTSGGWRLLDGTGVDFAGAPTRPAGLVLLATDPDRADPAAVRAAAQVVSGLPGALLRRVRAVTADSPDDVTLTLRDHDAHVRWGSAEQGDLKAEVLAALLGRAGAGPNVQVYDVSAPDAPTTQ